MLSLSITGGRTNTVAINLECAEAIRAYLAKAPYDAQAHFVRGYNLRFSGRPTEAAAAFRRVLEIAPDHRGAQAFLAVLEPAAGAKPGG